MLKQIYKFTAINIKTRSMKKLIIIGISIILFIAGACIYRSFINNNNLNEGYTDFLKSKYKEFASIDATKTGDIPKFDRPDIAAMQDFIMTVDPETKTVPRERLLKAYNHLQLKKGNQLKEDMVWTNIPVEMGGRTRALMFDPNDPYSGKVWAGAVTGGLWYNENIYEETSSWIPVNDFWDNLTTSVIAYDPNNTETFYVGTGESETAIITYRESSGKGVGIWKSTNAGETWTLLPSTSDFAYISDILVKNEGGSSVIYAAALSGLYKGAQHNTEPTDGLYRSSDGGESWEQVLPNIPGEDVPYAPSDIEMGADGRIYIGTQNNLDNVGGAVILYSDEGTAGSWTVYDNYNTIINNHSTFDIPGRIMLAAAPSDANRIYALVGSGYTSSGNGFNYYYCNYILHSNNKGETWTEKSLPADISSGENFATLAWHALVGKVNPTNPDELWVGGLDVFKTTDGGNTWLNRLSNWYDMYYGGGDKYVHADIHEIIYSPADPEYLLIGTDGGVFYTDNSTNNEPVFEQRNHNYSTLQFYTCDIAPPVTEDLLVGGLQDNGTLFTEGNPLTINDMIDGGDGAFCFFDENDPSGVLITSTYYNSYSFFWNNGNSSNYAGINSGIFINPADYDSELNTIYANAMMFSGDHQDQLLRISGVPETPSEQFINVESGATTPFSVVKVSKHSTIGTTTLILGTQEGRLFKVTNAESTPSTTEITGSSFPPANISSIDIGGSEDTLIVTFSNYGVPSIFQSYDGGNSWQLKEGDLPDMPVRWVLYHPSDAKKALIATEMGIWYCDHLNESTILWQPATSGLANVRVDMMQLRSTDNTVLAATHGRGLFTAPFGNPPALSADFVATSTTVEEGNSIDFSNISAGSPTTWEWTFEGGSPSVSSQQNPTNIFYSTEGSYDVTLTISNGVEENTITKENYITVTPEGIAQINQSKIEIFPNPTKDYVFVKNADLLTSYELFASDGKLLGSERVSPTAELKISLKEYDNGLYYLRIKTNKGMISKSILKN